MRWLVFVMPETSFASFVNATNAKKCRVQVLVDDAFAECESCEDE